LDQAFDQTTDIEKCLYCPYAAICSRWSAQKQGKWSTCWLLREPKTIIEVEFRL
jgi:hypothetical protein